MVYYYADDIIIPTPKCDYSTESVTCRMVDIHSIDGVPVQHRTALRLSDKTYQTLVDFVKSTS